MLMGDMLLRSGSVGGCTDAMGANGEWAWVSALLRVEQPWAAPCGVEHETRHSETERRGAFGKRAHTHSHAQERVGKGKKSAKKERKAPGVCVFFRTRCVLTARMTWWLWIWNCLKPLKSLVIQQVGWRLAFPGRWRPSARRAPTSPPRLFDNSELHLD